MTASTSRQVVAELMSELEQAFDHSTPIGSETLGSLIEERLLKLQAEPSQQQWGTTGSSTELHRTEAGPLRFFYRPHLFPDMSPALRLAHQLQFDLLPKNLPGHSPLEITAFLESYCPLRGDLLGWRFEDDELLLWIADVSGHGVRAGMAGATIYFFVNGMAPGLPPAMLARRLHEKMWLAQEATGRRKLFATAIFLRVRADGCIRYSSAGHGPLMIRRPTGEVQEFQATGPALGIWQAPTFEEDRVEIEKGSLLLLCTDGLVELQNSHGEQFGTAPLSRLMQKSLSPIELSRKIYQAISRHGTMSSLQDDLTFLSAALR